MRVCQSKRFAVAFCTLVMLLYYIPFCRFVVPNFTTCLSNLTLQAESETKLLDIGNELCFGNGIKPVLSMSSEVLPQLEFRQEKLKFLENFKNPCFFRNVTYYNKRPVKTPVLKLRCLPYLFIIGMPKCGTTDILKSLTLHPEVAAYHLKETEYIDRYRFPPYNWTIDQYLDVFHKATEKIASNPSHDKWVGGDNYYHQITGESSTQVSSRNDHWYLVPGNERCNEPRILNAHLLRHLNPNLKLIMTLRNPVDRIYSNYIYSSRIQGTKISLTDFHQAVLDSIKNHTGCRKYFSKRGCAYNSTLDTYKARLRFGMYHVFIEDWFRVFPAKQMMIVFFEDFIKDRVPVMKDIFKFLHLKPLSKEEESKLATRKIANERLKKDKDIGDMMNETRRILEKFYAPFNERLATLLKDKKFLWRN